MALNHEISPGNNDVLGMDGLSFSDAYRLYSNSFGMKWGDPTHGTSGGSVTWSLSPGVLELYAGDERAAIARAFETWGSVADIDFAYTSDYTDANIRLSAQYFDGRSGILGRASLRSDGDGSIASATIRFDSSENWTDGSRGINFYLVALHEIGHTLGLNHETAHLAVMNPRYNANLTDLQPDDIAGIQALYGSPLESPIASPLLDPHGAGGPIARAAALTQSGPAESRALHDHAGSDLVCGQSGVDGFDFRGLAGGAVGLGSIQGAADPAGLSDRVIFGCAGETAVDGHQTPALLEPDVAGHASEHVHCLCEPGPSIAEDMPPGDGLSDVTVTFGVSRMASLATASLIL